MSFERVRRELKIAEGKGLLSITSRPRSKSLVALFPQDVPVKAIQEIKERILKLDPKSIVTVGVSTKSDIRLMIKVSKKTKKNKNIIKSMKSGLTKFARLVERVIDPYA